MRGTYVKTDVLMDMVNEQKAHSRFNFTLGEFVALFWHDVVDRELLL